MVVESYTFNIRTRREGELVDITDRVQGTLDRAKVAEGVVFLFVPGSTGALTTIEYEPGLISDFPAALERLAPKDMPYEHEKHWHDGNGPLPRKSFPTRARPGSPIPETKTSPRDLAADSIR